MGLGDQLTGAKAEGLLEAAELFVAGGIGNAAGLDQRKMRLGNSLCGVGCYVQHNFYLTRGQPWGSFVEARTNAAEVYRAQYKREENWARKARGAFGIFLSSSTEPFQPAEAKHRVTQKVLEA